MTGPPRTIPRMPPADEFDRDQLPPDAVEALDAAVAKLGLTGDFKLTFHIEDGKIKPLFLIEPAGESHAGS